MLLAIGFLLDNAPALGAGDREFKSLYPDTRENHVSLKKSPVIRQGFLFIKSYHLYPNFPKKGTHFWGTQLGLYKSR